MNQTRGVKVKAFCGIPCQDSVAMSKDPTFPRRKVWHVSKHTRSIRQTARMCCLQRLLVEEQG